MRKTLCMVLALLLTVSVLFAGCNKSDSSTSGGVSEQTDGVAVNADSALGVKSDNKIELGESISQADLGSQADIFINGVYTLEGTAYSADNGMPVKFSTDGKNVQMTTSVEGITISFLILDGVTYMTLPNEKKYTELNEKFLSALGMDDSISSLNDFKNIDIENDTSASAKKVQNAVTINGEDGLCTEFDTDDTKINLYTIGDKLVQVDSVDANGNVTLQIVVSSITETLSADQLTLKGLESASVYSFISSITSAAAAAAK